MWDSAQEPREGPGVDSRETRFLNHQLRSDIAAGYFRLHFCTEMQFFTAAKAGGEGGVLSGHPKPPEQNTSQKIKY